jgi:TM2 domain-containing membrane protein YozV
MIVLAEGRQCVVSICKNSLMSPGFHSLYQLALVWNQLNLLLLFGGLVVFLTSLFILIFWLFLLLDCQHKLFISKIEESACNRFPLLLDVSLAIGINADTFLLHEQQSLCVQVDLLLYIV